MNDIANLMAQATRAFHEGDFPRARDIAQRAAQAQPKNPQVIQFLGIAQTRAGAPFEGLATLENALRIAPGDKALRLNTARAALDAGDAAGARRLCKPIAHDPMGLRMMAEAAKQARDHPQAIADYRQLVKLQPDDGQILNNLGNVLLEEGDAEEASEVLARAAALLPEEPQVWLNLGRAHTACTRYEEAEAAFDRAMSLNPVDPPTNFELGKSLFRHGRSSDALLRLSEAARSGIRDPQLFVLIGLSYAALEQREQAEQSYRVALSVDPSYARAVLALAILLEQGNRLEDLEALLADARAREIDAAVVRYVEALVLRRRGDLEGALDAVVTADPEHLDTVVRDQFIGQIADRLGNVDLAFASFSAMNEGMMAQPNAARYDGSEHRRLVAQRTASVTVPWYASWQNSAPPDGHAAPAFLGGFLRSGTTLLDTILMGHPQTEVREEEAMIPRIEEVGGPYEGLPTLTPDRIGAMRSAYFAELRRGGVVRPDARVIDKYPLMTLRAAYIHRAFPDAKFIFALRHPCDVVLSCWMQNFRVTSAMASFLTLDNAARLYHAAMTHWERCRAVMPLAVHTVRYEDMVVDLESELRPLIAFLELEWDDTLLDHQKTARDRGYIRTPSYAQVTEQVYTRSSGRWEAYRRHLEPILPILAPWIERFGYKPL